MLVVVRIKDSIEAEGARRWADAGARTRSADLRAVMSTGAPLAERPQP